MIFLEDRRFLRGFLETSDNNTINSIDYDQRFIIDEILNFLARKINRYAEQYLEVHEVSKPSKLCNLNQLLVKNC